MVNCGELVRRSLQHLSRQFRRMCASRIAPPVFFGLLIDLQFGTMCFVPCGCITILARISHWRGTRQFHERSKRRRRARSSQSLKSAGCIIVTDEPHNVGDPVSSGVISIKSMEGLPARAVIDVRCCKATRRRRELESSIRRRDRRRIIGEWALHRQDGIFGTDSPRMAT